MKKVLILLAFFLLIPMESLANREVEIWVDNAYIYGDVTPYVKKNRTMVPVRMVSEALGYDAIWRQDIKTVLFVDAGAENVGALLALTLGSRELSVGHGDDPPILMDVAPEVRDQRVFIPLRAVAEAFNVKVDWDQKNQTVIIEDKGFLGAYKAYKESLNEPDKETTAQDLIEELQYEHARIRRHTYDSPEEKAELTDYQLYRYDICLDELLTTIPNFYRDTGYTHEGYMTQFAKDRKNYVQNYKKKMGTSFDPNYQMSVGEVYTLTRFNNLLKKQFNQEIVIKEYNWNIEDSGIPGKHDDMFNKFREDNKM